MIGAAISPAGATFIIRPENVTIQAQLTISPPGVADSPPLSIAVYGHYQKDTKKLFLSGGGSIFWPNAFGVPGASIALDGAASFDFSQPHALQTALLCGRLKQFQPKIVRFVLFVLRRYTELLVVQR